MASVAGTAAAALCVLCACSMCHSKGQSVTWRSIAGEMGLEANKERLEAAKRNGVVPKLEAVRRELKKVMDSKHPKIAICSSTMGCHHEPVVSKCANTRVTILKHSLKVRSDSFGLAAAGMSARAGDCRVGPTSAAHGICVVMRGAVCMA